jgi:hypothetical protein
LPFFDFGVSYSNTGFHAIAAFGALAISINASQAIALEKSL